MIFDVVTASPDTVEMRRKETFTVFRAQVLSAASLAGIIQSADLYPDKRSGFLEEATAEMRRNVSIEPEAASWSFSIRFTSPDPRQAQRVVGRWLRG